MEGVEAQSRTENDVFMLEILVKSVDSNVRIMEQSI